MMIRHKLLAASFGLLMTLISGCSATISCHGDGSGGLFGARPGMARAARVKRRGRKAVPPYAPGSPLFPGDAYGQPIPTYAGPQAGWPVNPSYLPVMEDCGCGDIYSGFGPAITYGASFDGMHTGMSMHGAADCGCGISHSPPAFQGHEQYPMTLPPHGPIMHSPSHGMPVHPTPDRVFEAPKQSPENGSLPPVPADPSGSNTPGSGTQNPVEIEPMSWQLPPFSNSHVPMHPVTYPGAPGRGPHQMSMAAGYYR